ncbi:hypothetical protein PYCCODRAFT_1428812 [Trametes coccinea BRFM310]|uniref:Fungal-type protein kinase domain-containing protein n=1 Tax=Trametes coccinea (strain BRFM310) TaxID=1353009 RepID=A0A1Y2I709_TRAC3|nr:hypothetical protein PYCCODRAFT_1428812 [Trametes coccinea BRFM310]
MVVLVVTVPGEQNEKDLTRVHPNPAFFHDHLKACPASLADAIKKCSDVQQWISDITQVETKEASPCEPVAKLLSKISETVFSTLEDKPDIICAVGRDDGCRMLANLKDRSYSEGVPYHCIETIVGTKAIYGDGQAQATRYAFTVQQAHPDRPGLYCLSVTAGKFQVIYSSPAGIEASELTDWSDCGSLCAYIYSLYDPPADHVLYDHMIIPKEPASVPLGKQAWTIQKADGTCINASIIALGDPCSRRTTVFRAVHKGRSVIVKESFDCGRHYEGELLTLVHADGFLPGVVRHIVSEDVKNGDEPIVMRRKDGELTGKKRRVVLADPGEQLTSARSVNDLLMAIYDTLEGRPLLFSSPINFTWRHKTPELPSNAHDLYINLHGERRYAKYRDRPGTIHGGVPPLETDEEIEARARELPFSHRWEYDAESVFWTMYSALLQSAAQVTPRLLPAMAGVAPLLASLATHVFPSYTVMTPPPPHDDHLHEAMQRLILQYLVDNLDTPIPLLPGRLRPVANGADPVMHRGSYRLGRHAEDSSRGLKRRRDASDEVRSTRRMIRAASSRGGLVYEIVEEEEP